MTNEKNSRSRNTRSRRLVAIWQDVKLGQVRIDQVNRPWIGNSGRLHG